MAWSDGRRKPTSVSRAYLCRFEAALTQTSLATLPEILTTVILPENLTLTPRLQVLETLTLTLPETRLSTMPTLPETLGVVILLETLTLILPETTLTSMQTLPETLTLLQLLETRTCRFLRQTKRSKARCHSPVGVFLSRPSANFFPESQRCADLIPIWTSGSPKFGSAPMVVSSLSLTPSG